MPVIEPSVKTFLTEEREKLEARARAISKVEPDWDLRTYVDDQQFKGFLYGAVALLCLELFIGGAALFGRKRRRLRINGLTRRRVKHTNMTRAAMYELD